MVAFDETANAYIHEKEVENFVNSPEICCMDVL